jgi:hypothetical protein
MGEMRWDSSRPVPWQRLMREWLIYVGIMIAVLAIFFRDSGIVGAIAGLLVSGPLYVLFGFVMAKLGYQRRSLKEIGTPRAKPAKDADESGDPSTSDDRERPAPTRRTSGGGNRPKSKPRRR